MKRKNIDRFKANVGKTILRIVLIFFTLMFIFPLFWNIVNSFKTSQEYMLNPLGLPAAIQFDNYVRALEGSELLATLGNSVYVCFLSEIIFLVCCVPCSYALARYRYLGSKTLWGFLITGLFISTSYIMVPLFLELRNLKLLNNLTVLSAIYATGQFPFSVFLVANFMRGLPRDYEEAGILDGCNTMGILRYIAIPMSKSVILTVAMISLLSFWGEYMLAMVFILDPLKKTFPVGLANLYQVATYATDWGALFAGLTISFVPTFVLFLIGEKYAVKGMTIGGLKG